jgi:hypothetical protein
LNACESDIRSRQLGVSEGVKIDFTLALVPITLAFAIVGSVQFAHALPGGERGLLLFERACPIHGSAGREVSGDSGANEAGHGH